MRSLLWIVAVIVAMGVLVAYYADRTIGVPAGIAVGNSTSSEAATTSRAEPKRVATRQPPPAAASQAPSKPALPQVITLSSPGRTVTLRDDGNGHFRTEGRVDGRKVEFLVDTGASAVVLRASTAAQLGIRPAPSEYRAKVITANGETRAAVVQLSTVEVGDIVVRDVRALVQADEMLPMNLLGMTFLSRVRWMHDRGKLVLEQ
jgi:aspartyl protease family protein